MVAVLPLKSTVKTNRRKLMVTVNLVSILGMLALYVTHKDILKEIEGTYARLVKSLIDMRIYLVQTLKVIIIHT